MTFLCFAVYAELTECPQFFSKTSNFYTELKLDLIKINE